MQPILSNFKKGLVALVVLAASVWTTHAQDMKAKLPLDPKVKKGKFANGLTYYIRPNSKPEKKVELRLIVNAGSVLEDDDQQGLAHFMEHMNFNGSKNFPKNELVNYLQSIGVEFGADLNAYTSFDETVYILPVPTDKEGNLDKGFQIIEDWAHNALLTDKDIDDERGVVLEESRGGKGAEMRMLDKYLPTLMTGSKYASRLPIGKDDILKTFKYDAVRRFYREWYRPNLMAVAVVGDIDEATAMKYLKKHFEGMKNPSKERKRDAFPVPARTTSQAMVLTDKEATNFQLQIIFPSVKKGDESTLEGYRDNIKQSLITQMWNQRLNDLARSSNPPFPYAAVGYDGWARGYESLSAFAMFGAEGPEKAMNALTAELIRAKQFGFTNSELEIVKKGMMSFMEKAYNERNTTESGSLIGEYIRNFLEDEPIPGIEKEREYYMQLMPGITIAELNADVKSWMENMNTFSLITGPSQATGNNLPTDAQLLEMTKKGLAQKVTAMEEKKVAENLLDKKPTPGKIVSQKEDKEFGATTYTLSNGVKVTIKPTTFKSDEILLRGVRKGGMCNYGAIDRYSVQYATQVVGAMGYGNFPPTDLEKAIAGKTIRAGGGIGDINNTVTGNSTIKDFESMLELMYLKLTQPRKDEALFKAFVDKQKTQIQFMSANPQFAFLDTLYGVMYQKNPLAPIAVPKAEYYDAISMNRALEIYKAELGSADGMEFFITGNVDMTTALPLIEMYIGGLPVTGKAPSFKDNGVRPITGVQNISFKRGAEKQSLILAMYNGETKYSEDLNLKMNALAEILNIKVIEELREKLGGIYSGGFGANVSQYPYERYSASLYLPCGPENVEKLLSTTKEVVAAIKKNGPDAKDLDKVKAQWHEQRRDKMKENGFWNEKMESIMFWGKQRKNLFDYDKWVDSLTPNDIKEAANMLFNGKNEFVAVLYPES
ncbi:hypothetical protein CAP35_11500 [Chitinophagaceae bacterium IBVUCB1]|nr:hypothetical protein CAP35_11500 [Chitinophagaceae bacterium IBVUCB1]